MPRLDRLWYEIDAETKGFDDGILQAGNRLRAFTEYAKGNPIAVLGALGAAMTAAGLAFAAVAAKMASDFEREMKKVKVITGGSERDLAGMAARVTELFRSMPVQDLNTLTRGLQDIVGSGIEAGEAMEFLGVATKAAIGGSTDVATATKGLLTVVQAYRESGITVQEASDKMFTAVANGRSTFEELASSIGSIAPLAATYGVTLDDLLGTTAQLTINGLSTAEAFVAIRSAMVNVISPTGKLREIAPELAKEFTAARLETGGFAKFLGDLYVAADKNKAVLNALFSDVQGKVGVFSTLTDGGEGAAKQVAALGESAGATQAAANDMLNTSDALNQLLKNELTATVKDLGESVLPAWNEVLLQTIAIFDQKRAAAIDLRRALLDLGDAEAGRATGGASFGSDLEFELRARRRDGGLAGFLNRAPSPFGVASGGALAGGALGAERLLRGTNEDAKALAEVLVQFGEKGDEVFNDLPLRTLNDLADTVGRVRGQLSGAAAGELEEFRLGIEQARLAAQRLAEDAEEVGKGPPKAVAKPLPTPAELEAQRAEARARYEMAVDEANADLAKFRAALAEGQGAVNDALVASTATLQDDMGLALDRLIDELQTKGVDPEQIAVIRGIKEAAIIAQGAIEQVEAVVTRSQAANKAADRARVAVESLAVEMRLLETLKDQTLTVAARKQIEEQLVKLQRERERSQKAITDATKGEADEAERARRVREEATRKSAELARNIEAGARGALQLAEAFGLVDSQAAQALQSVVQIAANLSGAMAGDLGSLLSVGGGIASLASSLFGSSPAEQERSRIYRSNTDAIVRLTTRIGDLARITASGAERTDFVGILRRADAVTNENDLIGRSKTGNALQKELTAAGLTMDELREFARQYGIELGKEVSDKQIDQLLAAIEKGEPTQFGDTFSGQMERFRLELALMGDAVDEPVEQLQAFQRALAGIKDGGGLLAKTVKQFDLTTAEGVEAARKALQDLFASMPTLTDAELGGLSGQDFAAALQELMGIVDAAAAGDMPGAPGGTGGFNVDRSITEVTGSRLAGLLTAGNLYAALTAENTALIAEALTGTRPIPPVDPPVTGDALQRMLEAIGPAAGDTYTINVVVHLSIGPGTSPEDARNAGDAAGRAAAERIERDIADNVRRRRRASGDVTV